MPYVTDIQEMRNLITEYTQQKTLWIDTEVADFKSRKPRLSLIQILDNPQDMSGNSVYILDVLERPDIVAEFIDQIMVNEEVEKVFHNASYDVKFLGSKKAKNITCTLEMAKKIPYYLLPVSNYQLKTVATELCHFHHIDKQEQTSDWGKRPLTAEQIEYAYLDCIYLAQVHWRLLELQPQVNPEPKTEDISLLTARYTEIEEEWKLLNSEFEHLQERLKKAMQMQNITESLYFKLTEYERKTIKTKFHDLLELVQNQGIELDFSITLTENLRKDLGAYLEDLNVDIESNTYLRLTPKNQESGDK
ncbi:3'-5' exonuclease [Richelia sinica FACHB-800]|uniref:3'-5' exonuclease n=1 Tax=Richelia sinica FACHB-800 TaxID=1357546 RepID=A0A975Y419_9NOST|nr:ribonuclease D [Richelia sinica]MBD2663710.1 ribonuclease D [Richelia sinica FACHB-800]QXE22723.1 3'-5' exonuclease [Richelia sinica FACHB-800]